MSAGAAAVAVKKQYRFPDWCRGEVDKGKWTVVLNEILEVGALLFSPGAHHLLNLIMLGTIGNDGEDDGRKNGGREAKKKPERRPEWFTWTHEEIHKQSGLSLSTIEKGLRELVKSGAVESKRIRNHNNHRMILVGLRGLVDRFRTQREETVAAAKVKTLESKSRRSEVQVEEQELASCPACGYDLLERPPVENKPVRHDGPATTCVTTSPFVRPWDKVKTALESILTPEAYGNWVEHTEQVGEVLNGAIRVAIPNEYCLDWLQTEYAEAIRQALPEGVTIAYEVKPQTNGNGSHNGSGSNNGDGHKPAVPADIGAYSAAVMRMLWRHKVPDQTGKPIDPTIVAKQVARACLPIDRLEAALKASLKRFRSNGFLANVFDDALKANAQFAAANAHQLAGDDALYGSGHHRDAWAT